MSAVPLLAGNGRPLRFLALVSGGWLMLRIGLAWQATGSLPDAVREVLPIPHRAVAAAAAAAAAAASASASAAAIPAGRAVVVMRIPPALSRQRAVAGRPIAPLAVDPLGLRLTLLARTRVGGAIADDPLEPAVVGAGVPWAPAVSILRNASPARLSVGSWLIVRGGTGIGASLSSPQLGGTQGGARIDYAVTRGIAATMRVAAPAAGAGRELSLGVAWRPAGVPLRFVVEQRLALDQGRSGPALGVSGGVSDLVLPGRFSLTGYGQAGAILRDGIERYVDASVRVARPLTEFSGMPVDLGGGLWGGAQRGVARIDIGPSIGARLPLAGHSVRVALDWRQRIAGNARPGSGPALSIGADF